MRLPDCRLPVVLASCAMLALGSECAFANPTNPVVTNGAATFTQTGNLLQINNAPNTIINWGSFSIAASEITRFVQQSNASAVLNRVGPGGNPSQILGRLESVLGSGAVGGRVFLINPNGITFGAGSQINVGGLVASTLNMTDVDFLAGRMKFGDGLGRSIVNQGTITTPEAGSVYLIGNAVMNSGLITSPKGEVVLAAGNSIELVNPGTPNLRVEIVAPDNEALNLGSIVAEAGRIGIYAGLIRSSGTLQANSVQVSSDGQIILVARDIELSGLVSAGDLVTIVNRGGPRPLPVVNGSAGVTGQSNELTLTNNPGTILNWSAYSIPEGETERFIHNSNSPAVLNRVNGASVIEIRGVLCPSSSGSGVCGGTGVTQLPVISGGSSGGITVSGPVTQPSPPPTVTSNPPNVVSPVVSGNTPTVPANIGPVIGQNIIVVPSISSVTNTNSSVVNAINHVQQIHRGLLIENMIDFNSPRPDTNLRQVSP